MGTEALVQRVSQLYARREAIERELGEIDSRIASIRQILNGASDETRGSGPRMEAAQARGSKEITGGRKLHRWFESGEAVGMMKRLIRAPMPASDIVSTLAHAKGYNKGLAPTRLKRFQSTAYMAVTNAVKRGAATRLKDGRIRMRTIA